MLMNCGNYFTEKCLDNVIQALQRGCSVEVYIDCIGHTRNNYEQENFRKALIKKYGKRLNIESSGGTNMYSYIYSLKELKNNENS